MHGTLNIQVQTKEANNLVVQVMWEDGHVLPFPVVWLLLNGFSERAKQARRVTERPVEQVYWNRAVLPEAPRFDFEKVTLLTLVILIQFFSKYDTIHSL